MRTLLFFLLAAVIVVAILASWASYNQHHPAVSSILDFCYDLFLSYKWQIGSFAFLFSGIWSTIVRRRIKIGFIFLCLSIAFAFILPYLWPYIKKLLIQ